MKVMKTITTPTQRIPAGADLPDGVVLDGPLSRADWQRLGYLEAGPISRPLKQSAKPAPEPARIEIAVAVGEMSI